MAGRRLNTYVTVAGVTYAPGEVPDEVAEQIDAPGVFEDDEGYAAQTKADLEAEVGNRNESRADDTKIVVGGKGNKPDLIAALEADDA